MKPIRIGKNFRVYHIPANEKIGGWIKTADYLPNEYDLVYLKTSPTSETSTGWWTGVSWDGRRIIRQDFVLWKVWKENSE